jgi:hypothetical protein
MYLIADTGNFVPALRQVHWLECFALRDFGKEAKQSGCDLCAAVGYGVCPGGIGVVLEADRPGVWQGCHGVRHRASARPTVAVDEQQPSSEWSERIRWQTEGAHERHRHDRLQ